MDKKLQDELIGALIGLARATEGTSPTKEIYQTIIRGLTKYNAVDISDDEVRNLIQDVRIKKELLVPECSKCQAPCGRNDEYDMILGSKGLNPHELAHMQVNDLGTRQT